MRVPPGISVDASGAPAFDPSENVYFLVQVEKDHAREIRLIEKGHAQDLRTADKELAKERDEAEKRRVDDLAALRLTYDTRIAENLRVEVKTASEIISTQLIKEISYLSSQITVAATNFATQIASLNATFTTQLSALRTDLSPRIDRLEQAQLTSAGRASVADPAMSAAIDRMNNAITILQQTGSQGTGRSMGQGQVVAWIFAGVMALAAVLGPLITSMIHAPAVAPVVYAPLPVQPK